MNCSRSTHEPTLLALATRCEKACAEQQAALLLEAFVAIHGPKPDKFASAVEVYNEWTDRRARLQAMLAAEAYESAAIALIDPTRREWGFHHREVPKYAGAPLGSTAQIWRRGRDLCIGQATPTALAILSAELRARACDGGARA